MHSSIQCVNLAELYKKCIIFSLTLCSDTNGIFSAPKCFKYVEFSGSGLLYLSVCIYLFLFLFYSDHVCEHEMCWGTPLYCEQCVFKYTAVGFMEALKPFVGLFHNGSILSFALVQGIDPEFCV